MKNISSGDNLLMPDKVGEITELASQWIAGLLAHAGESCLLTTPTVNGYKCYSLFKWRRTAFNGGTIIAVR